jgi:hypothetical protein
MSGFLSITSLISTAWAWWGIIIWANMVSAALWSTAAAGAELDEVPELPWSMPGMLPPPEPVEQPAKAITAATVAERVTNFFIEISVLQYINRRAAPLGG